MTSVVVQLAQHHHTATNAAAHHAQGKHLSFFESITGKDTTRERRRKHSMRVEQINDQEKEGGGDDKEEQRPFLKVGEHTIRRVPLDFYSLDDGLGLADRDHRLFSRLDLIDRKVMDYGILHPNCPDCDQVVTFFEYGKEGEAFCIGCGLNAAGTKSNAMAGWRKFRYGARQVYRFFTLNSFITQSYWLIAAQAVVFLMTFVVVIGTSFGQRLEPYPISSPDFWTVLGDYPFSFIHLFFMGIFVYVIRTIEWGLFFCPTRRRWRLKRRRFCMIEEKMAAIDRHGISYADSYWSDEEVDSARRDPDIAYCNLASQSFNLASYICLDV